LYNQNILVSNLVVATLNATSQAASERVTVIELFLMSGIAKSSFLKLKVFDDEDNLNPLIEELVQDNTLIKSDF
jgi:thiazole synthase ThiGH ThiG subunit